MDLSLLTDAALGLLVAAQTGAVSAATDLAKKLGKGALDKLVFLVKDRFARDGQGAVDALERLEQQPDDAKAQNAVRRRLEGLLEEDPAFAAAIEAIIGQVTIDKSVRQTATAGDNSTITQIQGSRITIGPKS